MIIETPIGPMFALASEKGLCRLEFSEKASSGHQPHLEHVRAELADYFAGNLRSFTVPLDYSGTAFEERVWAELLRIPYGKTICYEQLAMTIGSPRGSRAVGTANGRNRIAIIIPCHRVINKGGGLGGYGGGLSRKRYLLNLESGVGALTQHAGA